VSDGRIVDRLQRLSHLQDLEMMIREAQDGKAKAREEEMGFQMMGLERLQAARDKWRAQVDHRDLRLFDRIVKRHPRAIVPVEDRICLGCYMALATSLTPPAGDQDRLLTCENCGRILYWLE
jgi:predicted  nucleic acid-binding Zn-ribbon protein